MATASSMIIRGLQMIGEKTIGGTLTSAEQTAYLSVLNGMLESWSLDSLMCYQELQESLALTAGTSSYTIGSGGAFNTTRPIKIVSAFTRDSSSYDYNIEIINDAAYNFIVSKTQGETYPSYLYYDHAYVAGVGTINLYPEPSAGLTLYISSLKQLTQFATIGEVVVLPPGYQRAIESNFAIEAAAGYIPVSKEVIQIAKESKSAIKNVNAPSSHLQIDFMGGGRSGARHNIFTGP